MIKRYVLKYILYTAVFACFALAEKALGLYGISIGFLFALFFCREKIFVALPCYFLAETLVHFSLVGLIYASGAVVAYAVVFLIHNKWKLKISFLEIALLIILSMSPYIGMNASANFTVILRILFSVTLSLASGYIGVLGTYPILIRGLRYKPASGEIFCIGLLVGVASIGLGGFELFNVKPYYAVVAFLLLFLKGTEKSTVLPFGVASALGASIGMAETLPLCAVTVAALVIAGTENIKIPFCAFVGAVVFFLATLFFGGKFDLYAVAPFVVGAIIASCIPTKLLKKMLSTRSGYSGRYAMRTIVNRDREDIAERIGKLSSAFYEMRDILCNETSVPPSVAVVVDSVCTNVCGECAFCARCVDAFDVKGSIYKLVEAANANGKATLLDVGVAMGDNCKKIGLLIGAVNEGTANFLKLTEKQTELAQGREMVISQMGGVAELLSSMSKSVKIGLSFDVDREKMLTERLAQANIIATDVMLYKEKDGAEATVVVREKDAQKPALPAIVSHVFGIKMTEYSRKKEINDMVGISFCKAPEYKLMYGECVYAKEERCGDTRQAVKIGKNKVMFVLSDGMGTGKNAQLTASNVIYLIETFYKAGFDHRTIFTSVSGMLSLRTKEDFSALDVAVVDLSTGDVDFIKQGGRESYVLSKSGCEEIEGGTLPMGILPDSVPRVERRRLCVDETVILMSDGVADALNSAEINEIAVNIGLHNPKTVADEIVKNAQAKCGFDVDDMTVMAFRLVKA